jgi:hypothetical protein
VGFVTVFLVSEDVHSLMLEKEVLFPFLLNDVKHGDNIVVSDEEIGVNE